MALASLDLKQLSRHLLKEWVVGEPGWDRVFQSSQQGSWGDPHPEFPLCPSFSSTSNPPTPPHGMCFTVHPLPRFPDCCFLTTHPGGREAVPEALTPCEFPLSSNTNSPSQDTWLSLLPLAHIIKHKRRRLNVWPGSWQSCR